MLRSTLGSWSTGQPGDAGVAKAEASLRVAGAGLGFPRNLAGLWVFATSCWRRDFGCLVLCAGAGTEASAVRPRDRCSLRGRRVFVRPSSFRVCVLLPGNHCEQWSIYQILGDTYAEIRGHGNFGVKHMCLVVLGHYGRESSGVFPVLEALAL